MNVRWFVVFASLAAVVPQFTPAAGPPVCNTQTFGRRWCVANDTACGFPGYPAGTCEVSQSFYCGDGTPTGPAHCAGVDTWGWCWQRGTCDGYASGYEGASDCAQLGTSEQCGPDGTGNGQDDNFNGCIDEGCIRQQGSCSCETQCATFTCNPPQVATCEPTYSGAPDACGDGLDDNCNGIPDENCCSGKSCKVAGASAASDDACAESVGKDPILIASQAAVTEPFADFSIEHVTMLAFTRTYNSSDASIRGGAPGIFGRGWHHDWEAALRCEGQSCTITRGLASGLTFRSTASALSLDGTEVLSIYEADANGSAPPDHRDVLVRRPNGAWVAYLSDGREFHFATVCDACSGEGTPARCLPPESGGTARLVKIIDRAGNAVTVSYDRPGGLLAGLYDDLGHSLELYGSSACTNGLATELRYGGTLVAGYSYSNGDLTGATGADGRALRSYEYVTGRPGMLHAVLNEAGDPIAEFSYDAIGRATGIVDEASSASIDYDAPGGIAVTEYFRDANGDTSQTGVRTLNGFREVASISDGCACGPARNFEYDGGVLTCQADAAGHVKKSELDELGRVRRTVEFQGASCVLPSPLPAVSRDERRAYGLSREIAQDVWLNLDAPTSVTRPSTLSSPALVGETYDYDQGVKAGDPTGYACVQSRLPAGSVVCRSVSSGYVTGANGVVLERHTTFFSYDARGRLIRTYGPVNLDAQAGDVVPLEERTYWSDDATLVRRGRLHEVKRYPAPNGAPLVTSYDYDLFGVYQVIAPNGAITYYVKDGRGRITHVLSAAGQREIRYYDGEKPRLELFATGAAVRSIYDSRGRLRGVERISGDPEAPGSTAAVAESEWYTYDESGNRIRSERRDAQGTVTWTQDRAFDVQHRVTWESNPAVPSTARTWAYDATGFLTETTDEEGRATEYTPDPLNRVSSVKRTRDAEQFGLAVYAYHPGADMLSSVIGGNGVETTYRYDDFARAERIDSPGHRAAVDYFYDTRGNVVHRLVASGSTELRTTYSYDGVDRILSTLAEDATQQAPSIAYQYRYDENGFVGSLTTTLEPGRTVQFGYDATGRLTGESVSEPGAATALVTSYVLDGDGQVSEITYPSGLHLRYDRDPATRRIARITNVADGTRYADNVTTWPTGATKALLFGNGLGLSQTFNERYEPVAIDSGPLALSYGMTPAGDVAFAAGSIGASPGPVAYDHDGNGNRISEMVGGVESTYAYATGTDRITDRSVAGKRTHAFMYDSAGNLSGSGVYDAQGTVVTQAMCLHHDVLGRMVLFGGTALANAGPDRLACSSEADVASAVVRFRYDSSNRRVARQDVAAGQWKHTVFDRGGRPLSELLLSGSSWERVRDYVWLDDRPLAQIEYPGPLGSSEGYAYYIHADHLGTPRAMTNANAQMVWSTSARPYGDAEESTTTDPLSGRAVVTNLRLPGQYDERLLGSVGLQGPYYNWNRWYLPGVGRYLELDPVALEGGLNGGFAPEWYAYGAGNPLTYTDPEGLSPGAGAAAGFVACGPPCALAGAAIGAAAVWAAACTATNTCPWSRPSCAQSAPWSDPRPQPVPLPPLDLSPKRAGCACKCFGVGWGPDPMPRQKNAFACESACIAQYWDRHPGNVASECK